MRFTTSALCLALAACGGDDGQTPAVDAMPAADAPVDATTCTLLETDYGDLGAQTGQATLEPDDAENILKMEIPLNQETPPDVLFIELYDDSDPFSGGLAAGTYTIIDFQADIVNCGACVYIAADREVGQPLKFHMASSGTLTIDAVDATPGTGSIQGSLAGINLREVEVQQGGQVVVENGCRTAIGSDEFRFHDRSLTGSTSSGSFSR